MKQIFISSCLFFLVAFATAQTVQSDIRVRWGEEDSTSYVQIKNGKFGIVMEGKETIPPIYDIENFQEAVNYDGNAYFSDGADFVLGLNVKWGVINNRGVVKIPFEYDYIRMERAYEDQQMEFAGVQKNEKIALMDRNGKLLTGFDYDAFYGYYKNSFMMSLSSTRIALQKGNTILFYDPSTKKMEKANDDVFNTPESKIVWYKDKAGVISRNGELLLPAEYDNIYSANDAAFQNRSQLLSVSKNGKFGIWQYGKGLILPMQYSSARVSESEGKRFFIVSENEKYALLDEAGKNLTDFEYTSIYIYENNITGTKGDDEYRIAPDGKATLLKKQ